MIGGGGRLVRFLFRTVPRSPLPFRVPDIFHIGYWLEAKELAGSLGRGRGRFRGEHFLVALL
jgi:hypothetical protein